MIINRNKTGRIEKQYNDEDFISLCEEYAINRNAKEIAIREGIPLQTMYYYIRKLGYNKPRRIHCFNEDYFHNVNSQNKAYILGFIMADGCVCKSTEDKQNPDRLIINISHKDKCILEFIKEELGCDYIIKDYIPTNTYAINMMSSLTINSTKMCNDLMNLGIIPNKTGYESFPNIRTNLKRHFIRGFLDGDGWVTNSSGNTFTIGFISNSELLHDIKSILKECLDLQSTASITEDSRENKKNKNIFYLQYSRKEDVQKLKHFLYHKANFYLSRKYSKLP